MASSLDKFLNINKKKEMPTSTVLVWRDVEGGPLEVDVKGLTTAEFRRIQKLNKVTYPPAVPGGPAAVEVDEDGLALDIMDAAITGPDLNSAKLQNGFKAFTRKALIEKMFGDREEDMNAIVEAILQLSGKLPTAEDVESDEFEEAKNS